MNCCLINLINWAYWCCKGMTSPRKLTGLIRRRKEIFNQNILRIRGIGWVLCELFESQPIKLIESHDLQYGGCRLDFPPLEAKICSESLERCSGSDREVDENVFLAWFNHGFLGRLQRTAESLQNFCRIENSISNRYHGCLSVRGSKFIRTPAIESWEWLFIASRITR